MKLELNDLSLFLNELTRSGIDLGTSDHQLLLYDSNVVYHRVDILDEELLNPFGTGFRSYIKTLNTRVIPHLITKGIDIDSIIGKLKSERLFKELENL